MRFWTLVLIVLMIATAAMLIMLLLATNTTQTQYAKVTVMALAIGDNPQAASGVAARVIVPRPHTVWNNYSHRYAIVRPCVAVKPIKIWTICHHGIRSLNRTWTYHRRE